MKKENWFLKRDGLDKDKLKVLMEGLSIDKLTATILLNRGLSTIEEGKYFLEAGTDKLFDSYLMKDMKKAVKRMVKAITKKEKITIYGDYDCDGVSSTSILIKALERCGANFNYHIPNRESEGYGMNCDRVKILADEGTNLIITCDNGIAAFEEIKLANELGMEVILTDHHDIQLVENKNGEKELKTPEAFAVVNPHQNDCNYPFELLCGAGIAFKLSMALYKELGIDRSEALELVEICAIATVCDIVDLKSENRIIVKAGLEKLNNSKNKGVIALRKACDLEEKELTAYHLGFVIGPCINATGRLEVADLAVELLTTDDDMVAEELANKLVDLNERRKELTAKSVEEVMDQIEKDKLYNDKVIMVYNPNIHESIAGIVAGRVKEIYNIPTIVMTKGSKMPKGSARSIEEYNMFEELSKCKNLMDKFGGHPMAAGLSAKEENLPKIKAFLNENCPLSDEDVVPKIKIDTAISVGNLSEEIIEIITKLEPFGKGNATPVIAAKSIYVKSMRTMGADKNHLRFECVDRNTRRTINGVMFSAVNSFREIYDDRFGHGSFDREVDGRSRDFCIDAIYKPSINEFRGNRNIQMIINNIRISK